MTFPKNIALFLEHNPFATDYSSVEAWLADHQDHSAAVDVTEDDVGWPSPEERAKAVATGELWVMHWYPETPIGFHRIAAATLEALLAYAQQCEAGDRG